VPELRDGVLRELTTTVAAVVERAGVPDVRLTAHVGYGHPAEQLINAAGTDGLLVVGSRGRGGVAGVLLVGSVSMYCITHWPCPVAVARDAHSGAADTA
jgi:nucleotide-binding universal stress UspA family protein